LASNSVIVVIVAIMIVRHVDVARVRSLDPRDFALGAAQLGFQPIVASVLPADNAGADAKANDGKKEGHPSHHPDGQFFTSA
jgi:hypothetical protein